MICGKCGAVIDQPRPCGWRICSTCYKKSQATHYAKNRDKRLEYQREYEREHKESRRVYKHTLVQKAATLQRNRAYYVAHKEVFFLASKNRQSLKRATVPSRRLTHEEWEFICESFGYACAYCLGTGVKLTMDHVIPLSKGGEHSAENIVPACMGCNLKKSARLIFCMLRVA